MTKKEMLQLLDAYDRDPDGVATCDNLCAVAEAIPEKPDNGETSDELRAMVEALDD